MLSSKVVKNQVFFDTAMTTVFLLSSYPIISQFAPSSIKGLDLRDMHNYIPIDVCKSVIISC